MSKKKLLSLALVVIMVALLSFSTLAWFTDNETVTNEFMIANSEDDTADEIFSVDVWEDRNNDGNPDNDLDGDKEGLQYKDVLPGDVLPKVVNIQNTGYYDQYIRITVTVSDAAAWMTVLNTNGRVPYLNEIVDGFDPADTWADTTAVYDDVKDEIVYTAYYRNILNGAVENDYDNNPNNLNVVTVFEAVKIPASMTQEQAVAFEHNFFITVMAEAVQTENVGATAQEAFATIEG